MTSKIPWLLASSSPRRRDLLSYLSPDFETMSPDIDESPKPGEPLTDYAIRNATEKAKACQSKYPHHLIIAADTIVTIDGYLLEKPLDESDAKRMLSLLAGREHEVISGFAVALKSKLLSSAVTSRVLFKDLSVSEIDNYIAMGESLDKSGAYAAQGKGMKLIKAIHGSPSNIIGLPIVEVNESIQVLLGCCS